MKRAGEIFTTVGAVIIGIFPAIVVGFFGLLIYDKNRGPVGIALALLVGALGLFIGFQVFRMAKRRGILAFITTVNASPDMDNLEPSGKEVERVKVKELVESINSGDNIFKGGNIRIWGDWKERGLEAHHRLIKANYIDTEKLLKISFEDSSEVHIWNPQLIQESDSYFKIVKADKVRWEWMPSGQQQKLYYYYWIENEKIVTVTNSNWKSDKMDVLLEEPATLMVRT